MTDYKLWQAIQLSYKVEPEDKVKFDHENVFRAAYLNDKQLAETGTRIEKGESVQPKKTPNINHSIWLATMGAGFGKRQWRLVLKGEQYWKTTFKEVKKGAKTKKSNILRFFYLGAYPIEYFSI